MFKTELGIDLGSKNTRLALKDGCFIEPSLIALQMGEKADVRAFGEGARFMEYGRVAPIKGGCCANVKLLALMLSSLAKKYAGRSAPRRAELFAALPRTMQTQRLRAFEKAAETAGFRGFHVLERLLMGALGAGEDILSSSVRVVVDIGAQTTCCAAIACGGIIYESAESFGSELADRAIQNYFASAHGVHIGSRVAELIKMNLDRLGFTVDGRSLWDGLPRAVEADAQLIRAAALGGLGCIVSFTSDMLRHLPAEACADVVENGITLIGGGAKMHGICELFEEKLGVSAHAAENAETAVADGMRRYLFTQRGRAGGAESDLYALRRFPENYEMDENQSAAGEK